jgi:hypothetical protein
MVSIFRVTDRSPFAEPFMPMVDSPQHQAIPRFWDCLCSDDQVQYRALQHDFGAPNFSNRRGRSKEQFEVMLGRVKEFVVRGDADDLNRGLVCGVVWMAKGLAVNVQQMKLLTSKCKSSINGSFGMLGYGTIPAGADSAVELIAKFPFMKSNFGELRQWTMRQLLSDKADEPKSSTDLLETVDLSFDCILAPEEFSLSISLDDEFRKMSFNDLASGCCQYETPSPSLGDVIDSEMMFGRFDTDHRLKDDPFMLDHFGFQVF